MPYMSRLYRSKETIKLILTIIAMEFGIMHLVVRAGEEPAWSLEGRMISADSCGVDCHCIIVD
jgi:hypothetical protein